MRARVVLNKGLVVALAAHGAASRGTRLTGTVSRVATLLFAAGILLVGHGLQLTLLPVYAQSAGWTNGAIGLSGSAYFGGFIAGCILNPGVVSRVGHIRAFMVMGAIATVALLAAGLILSLPAWIVFRFATGFALAGLYMVIESWLSEVSPREQRGAMIAIYAVVSLAAMALGQPLMGLGAESPLTLFVLAAIMLVLAIVPIGLTSIESPPPIPRVRFTLGMLREASRVATVCAVFAGAVTGSVWTLGPVLGRALGLEPSEIGLLMSAAIIGGAVTQFPVGRLSDVTDRRFVIGGMALIGSLVSVVGWRFAGSLDLALYSAMFMLGAASMPLYSLCIAHASDRTSLTLVEVTSSVLIMNSIGSIIGPAIVAVLMDAFGPSSFFAVAAVSMLMAAIWTFHRALVVERRPHAVEHAALLPRTTQAIAELSTHGERH